jgi:hypothetical protein
LAIYRQQQKRKKKKTGSRISATLNFAHARKKKMQKGRRGKKFKGQKGEKKRRRRVEKRREERKERCAALAMAILCCELAIFRQF